MTRCVSFGDQVRQRFCPSHRVVAEHDALQPDPGRDREQNHQEPMTLTTKLQLRKVMG